MRKRKLLYRCYSFAGFSSWIVRCFARCNTIHGVRGNEEQVL